MRYSGLIKSGKILAFGKNGAVGEEIGMSGIDILMAADRAAGKILASLAGIKKMDVAGDREAEEKISENAKRNTVRKMNEYLVRGAVLVCSKGSHKRKINLPKCHGIYIGELPVLHELECKTECQCGLEKCNITYFGVCEAGPPTEIKTYLKTPLNSRDGSSGTVSGCKCEPVIIGRWKNCCKKTKIIDNGMKNSADRKRAEKEGKGNGQNTLTMQSFLICKYGGIIEPVESGQ